MINEFELVKEDLSEVDCGGGMRSIVCKITIDSSKPLSRQKAALIYEYMASYYAHITPHNELEDMADELCELLDYLEGLYH